MSRLPNKAAGRRANTAPSHLELRRILELPFYGPIGAEESEYMTEITIRKHYRDLGIALKDLQAEALLTFQREGSVFGPIGVGHGKTGISIRIAQSAYEGDHRVILIAMPPTTVPQFVKHQLPLWRQWSNVSVPIHNLHKKRLKERLRLVKARRPGLYIMPYSLFSREDADEVLEELRPTLMILDEAHNFADPTSAKTGRFLRYLSKYQPRLALLSGTMTDKRMEEYHHLLVGCLLEGCPVPIPRGLMMSWAEVLDSDSDFASATGDELNTGLTNLGSLIAWYKNHFPGSDIKGDIHGIRRAYRARLKAAPGVVASADDDIGVSLEVDVLDPKPADDYPGLAEVRKYQKQIEDEWLSPSGDEIEYALHKWKYQFEVGSGIFHKLSWPDSEDDQLLALSQDHHQRKQEYHRQLRRWLGENDIPRLDTPMLVGNSMWRHGNQFVQDADLYGAWTFMKEIEPDEDSEVQLLERLSDPIRVCDFKIQQAVRVACAWASGPGSPGGLMWYHHRAVGKWLAEQLAAEGLDVLHCPAGSAHDARILDPSNAKRVIVASLRAHGEGKNLQYLRRAHYVQRPRQARMMQQSLGRIHRMGQKEDSVLTTFPMWDGFDAQQLAATLIDSVYQQHTIGQEQKILSATWLNNPPYFPPEYLYSRGLECKRLDAVEAELYRSMCA